MRIGAGGGVLQRAAGALHDLGELVERLHLVGDHAAHGGGLFGGFTGKLHRTAAQVLARGLQFAAHLVAHAAHFADRVAELIHDRLEHMRHLGARIGVGALQHFRRARALGLGGGAHFVILLTDHAGDVARFGRQQKADVARALLGGGEGILHHAGEGAHDRVEGFGAGLHIVEQGLERDLPALQRCVEMQLVLRQRGRRLRQFRALTGESGGERTRMRDRGVRALADGGRLFGDGAEGFTQLVDAMAERLLDSSKAAARLIDDGLKRLVRATEIVEHRHHLGAQLVIGAHERLDRARRARLDGLAQGFRRAVDGGDERLLARLDVGGDRRALRAHDA